MTMQPTVSTDNATFNQAPTPDAPTKKRGQGKKAPKSQVPKAPKADKPVATAPAPIVAVESAFGTMSPRFNKNTGALTGARIVLGAGNVLPSDARRQGKASGLTGKELQQYVDALCAGNDKRAAFIAAHALLDGVESAGGTCSTATVSKSGVVGLRAVMPRVPVSNEVAWGSIKKALGN